jgi:hypothetical protein
MHATLSINDTMVICGGRMESGALLSDLWTLKLLNVSRDVADSTSSSSSSTSEATASLIWEEHKDCSLPLPRCAHTINSITSLSSNKSNICIYGGIEGDNGISNNFLSLSFDVVLSSSSISSVSNSWEKIPITHGSIPARFGHVMTNISSSALHSLTTHSLYGTIIRRDIGNIYNNNISSTNDHMGMMLFGGVNADHDMGDIWLLLLS